MRAFAVTLPADTDPHNLYDMLLALPDAVPVDGILPDRVSELTIKVTSGDINVVDRQSTTGLPLSEGEGNTSRSNRNTICLRDYHIAGAVGSEEFSVIIEFK